MTNHKTTTLILFLAITAMVSRSALAVDFNRDVRPILSNNCFQCHGPDAEHREADLRLDVEGSVIEDRGDYAVVDRQNAAESELLKRIESDDTDLMMPPPESGKELSPEQVAILRAWIESGGEWKQHWAYEPPVRFPTPQMPTTEQWKPYHGWARNWIDHFIARKLAAENLIPSPDANPVTLARRLSFDLTGLPSSVRAVEKFVADRSPESLERFVDQLLASPAFGERMAAYWLDLVRFADTVGYHGDQDHNVSPYRDYVIHAFNDNIPFDQFTVEQLAGDLLPDATVSQKIASCYNRLLQTSHEGGVQPKEYLAIYSADRVRNLSAVWMGATLGCAQCHDHKFDPYTAKDFYAMAAFFADVDDAKHFKVGSNDLPTKRPPEMQVLPRWRRERLSTLASRLDSLRADLAELDGDPSSDSDAIRSAIESVEAEISNLNSDTRTVMVTESLEKPRTIRLLPRGNWLDDSGPVIDPAVPEFLATIPKSDVQSRLSRLDLARWLTDPDQAGLLTARVFVNRFWYLLFGSALSNGLDDFGGQGEPPTHPELLDRLAWEFIESGWDVKHMFKLIVLSRAYQQSSVESDELRTRDPYNRLYARQSRYRLDAEMVRDNALAVSGLLTNQIGGPSVKPYQPPGYYRHLNFPQRKYKHHTDTRQWRRGLYVHWQRQFLHPMMKAFDAPSREECTAARPRSNNALAALTLLNDPTFVEAARVFASRIVMTDDTDDRSRLRWAFRAATSRQPSDYELEVMTKLLIANRDYYSRYESEADQLLQVGLATADPTNNASDVKTELASWTMVARAVLNLNETITRN